MAPQGIQPVESVKTINDVDEYSCVRHVSVQTGEEFSPEFLRERKPRLDTTSEESFPSYNQNLQIVYENGTGSGIIKRDSEYSNRGFPVEVEKIAYPVSGVPDCSFPGKLKFLCSFGGKILPRPSDGKLRYVGGDTRIISIKKNIDYQELTRKTFAIWNQPHLIKYQLPDEDLDALISVCSNDDLQHMIEEYHELEKSSQRLRVFLSSLNEPESPTSYDSRSVDQSETSSNYEYVVAVNGIPQLSLSKCSSKENIDRGNMVFSQIDSVAGSSNLSFVQMPPGDLLTSDVQSAPPGMPVQLTEVTNTKLFVESGSENRPDLKKQYIVWEEDMITWTDTNDSNDPQENPTSDLMVAENDYILSSNSNENSQINVAESQNSAIVTTISTDVSLVESFEDNLIDNSLSLTSDDKNVDDVTELPELVENITDILPPCIPLATIAVPYIHEVTSVSAAQSDENVAYEKRVNDEFIGTAPAEVEAGLHGLQIIKNADLEELRELGSGTFGTVYHGKWRGTDVAIKRIRKRCFQGKSSEQERLTKDFWREALMLSNLHHPNVVALYGVVPDGPGGTLSTVTEYMTNGSLRHVLLRNNRSLSYLPPLVTPSAEYGYIRKYFNFCSALDWRRKLIIAQDAAIGMEYLHLKKIIHFDLKCENLLVTMGDPQRPICKVGDFGLSRIKRNTFVSGGVRGTLPWMAPELLNGSSTRVSEKVDVFSFGIVMWEILTEDEPYADMHCGAIIGGIVSNMLRPPIPENCDRRWKDLMEECWSHDPAERPIFTEITNKLQALLMSLPSKRNNNAKEDMLKV